MNDTASCRAGNTACTTFMIHQYRTFTHTFMGFLPEFRWAHISRRNSSLVQSILQNKGATCKCGTHSGPRKKTTSNQGKKKSIYILCVLFQNICSLLEVFFFSMYGNQINLILSYEPREMSTLHTGNGGFLSTPH